LGARNRAADQNEATIGVRRDNFNILRGHAGLAHMTSHLLALEHLARVLTLTGRAVSAVGNGVTVRGTMTGKIVALHDTGKTLTDRSSRHIDLLAGDEMFGGDFRADFEEVVRGNAEFRKLR